MKIIEETPDVLRALSPRPLVGDIVAALFAAIGMLLFAIAATTAPGSDVTLTFSFGVIFVALANLLFWNLTSTHVTLDASSQTMTIRWRNIFKPKSSALPFSQIAAIKVHITDAFEGSGSIVVTPVAADVIFLEVMSGDTGNRDYIAHRMQRWLDEQRRS